MCGLKGGWATWVVLAMHCLREHNLLPNLACEGEKQQGSGYNVAMKHPGQPCSVLSQAPLQHPALLHFPCPILCGTWGTWSTSNVPSNLGIKTSCVGDVCVNSITSGKSEGTCPKESHAPPIIRSGHHMRTGRRRLHYHFGSIIQASHSSSFKGFYLASNRLW